MVLSHRVQVQSAHITAPATRMLTTSGICHPFLAFSGGKDVGLWGWLSGQAGRPQGTPTAISKRPSNTTYNTRQGTTDTRDYDLGLGNGRHPQLNFSAWWPARGRRIYTQTYMYMYICMDSYSSSPTQYLGVRVSIFPPCPTPNSSAKMVGQLVGRSLSRSAGRSVGRLPCLLSECLLA